MDRIASSARLTSSARHPAKTGKIARAIQPAATKPVKTTLAQIRWAVRKSIREQSATLHA